MAKLRTQKKTGEQHQYLAGQVTRREFARGGFMRRFMLRVTGNLVVSGGTTDGVLVNQGVLNLLPNLKVEGDGRAVLKDAPAKLLFEKAKVWGGVSPRQTDPAVGVGTNPFSFEFPVFFELPYQYPDETLVDTGLYGVLEHVLLWGNGPDAIIRGGDRTESLTSVVADLLQYDALKKRQGDFGIHREYVIEKEVTASSTQFQIKLNTGNIIPFLVIAAYDQDGNAVDVAEDDIINYLTIKGRSGAVYFDRIAWQMLKADNNLEGQLAPSTGYAFINPIEDGMLSSGFVTKVNDDLILEMDVTKGTNKTTIRVLVTEIVLPTAIGTP